MKNKLKILLILITTIFLSRQLRAEDILKQVTHELGYDGGAFFSPDGTKLIFRSSRPKTE